MTIQDAAKNPAVHKALLQKIDRDQKEIQAYKVGHVVVGRIQLDGTDDPEFIRSQMMIFEEGFFSDAVRDLKRPIAFRMLGYRPVDAAIPAGASPDDSGAIDLGTIRMEKCAFGIQKGCRNDLLGGRCRSLQAFRSCCICLAGELIRLITELSRSESMLHPLRPRLTNREASLRLASQKANIT